METITPIRKVRIIPDGTQVIVKLKGGRVDVYGIISMGDHPTYLVVNRESDWNDYYYRRDEIKSIKVLKG